jgi:hypothetical protein
LELVLDNLDLEYLVKHDVLLITTKEAAAKMVETRVYDVRRLSNYEAEELARVISMTVAPETWLSEFGEPGVIEALPDALVVTQSQKVHRQIVDLLEQLQRHAAIK